MTISKEMPSRLASPWGVVPVWESQLLDGEPTPHHVLGKIVHFQLVHIPGELGTVHRISVDFRIQSVPLWCREFLYGDGTEGDSLKGPQVSGGVRGQFLCHSLAAKLVAHLVHSPSQGRVALGRAAGLRVFFLQLERESSRLVLH